MTVRLLTDENFDDRIIHGLRQRNPEVDIVSVQEVGLRASKDPVILEWAAVEGRVLLTHDASTMPDFAYDRIGRGAPTPGVLIIRGDLLVGRAIEEIMILLECSLEDELHDRVWHLPL